MSSTDVVLNVASAARLFHASDGTGLPTSSSTATGKPGRFAASALGPSPSPAAMNAGLKVLEAQAQFDQRNVSVRLAEQDGLIHLDLADEFWRCIEIGPNAWRIAEDPPVRFGRSARFRSRCGADQLSRLRHF